MVGVRLVTIEFAPFGRCHESALDDTLLKAALDAGVPLASSCEGTGVCRACRVLVLQGEENLSPPDDREIRAADELSFDPNERLACLARIRGPVRITTRYW